MHKALIIVGVAVLLSAGAVAAPVHLRCEYLVNPMGIDAPSPRLSWQSDSTQRDWHQTAYEIRVATSAGRLRKPDVWDSGKQASAESVGIAYAGPKLESRRRYYWAVRVWDSKGRLSTSAETAWWEMGLLGKTDWSAQWIRWPNPEDEADRAGIRWIWHPGQNASAVPPKTVCVFRLHPVLAGKPRSAALFVLAKGNFQVTVNGHDAGRKSDWHAFDRREIGDLLVSGKNSIEVTVTVSPRPAWGPDAGAPTDLRPAGLAALLKIVHEDGTVERTPTSGVWEAHLKDEAEAKPAKEVAGFGGMPPLPQPAALLRHEFAVPRDVRRARIYVTALGGYRLFLNGQRAGDDVLTPDFTDYRKRVLYQTYDVTGLLAHGQNALGAILGDGWFASPLTWHGLNEFPGAPGLRAQMEIEYTDGSHQTLATDPTWKTAPSAIVDSSIYGGEVYDARLQTVGWDKAGFDDSHWLPAVAGDPPSLLVSSQMLAPVRVAQTLQPKSVTRDANGAWIFDMGQNMVGWAALRVQGAAGTMVRMRFAEILNPDGTVYRDNLRNADATDIYTLRGGGPETFRPHFTFHGFRYVEVTGYPGTPTLADLTGEVASSVTGEPGGRIATSSDLVNRMWSIGLWGQRGNFLSIPTDCPQRDERLGWMGDAGVFWRTGTYNFDVAAFSRKWMRDVADAQTPQGAFTNVSPNLLPEATEGAPGWGDAGVIVPWTSWLQYGDAGIVEENWDAMQRWMQYIQDGNPDFLRKNRLGPNFADWLAPDNRTPGHLIGTAYWAMLARMMSQMGHAIGRDADAKRYDQLYDNIRAAFRKEYIKDDGSVGTGTQTSYVLALQMKLVPEALKAAAADKLVKDIEAHQWHLTTGFLGTPHLLFALADHGHTDVAWRLLLNETYPSWGYMLSKGATTWWERWNGDTGDPAMNSFNHYAFGSVVAWVYRYAAGIDTRPEAPGFHEIVIQPRPDQRMTHARAEYDSVYGRIVSDWTAKPGEPLSLRVTIPANTTARVVLPAGPDARVTEGGRPARGQREADGYVVRIGSGSYTFSVSAR
ncbi:MAG: glycoside hydrolase family 78 protein [Bryobacteraceae bacterium]|jgi:alpha-L-rhamnosidase